MPVLGGSRLPSSIATSDREEGRALVIGCGFIGSRLTEELLRNGAGHRVLTRSRPGEDLVARLGDERLVIGDAGDRGVLGMALDGIDHVVYAAGGLLPVASEREPDRDAELTLAPLRTLLAELRTRPDISLTYLSSGGTIYGEPEVVPVDESQPTRPRGVYGRLHLLCEEEVLAQVREHGLRARILRCSTVYGEGQRPDRGQGVVATFLSHIERGVPIELFGGGSTIRDYLYVGDLARIIVDLLDVDGGPTILNVGSGEGTSLIEILRLVEGELGKSARVVRREERAFEVHQIVLDVSQLDALIDLPRTPLDEGIHRTRLWLADTASRAA